jgi:putative addiction module component (TIGR02574 family)
MAARFEEITQVALALPLDERAKVASALLASLDEPADDPAEVHAAWTAEIRSRIDDIRSGRVQAIPLEQIKAELAERRAFRNR